MTLNPEESAVVREGESLDAARLEPYLRDFLPDAGTGFEIRQFPGGHSNLTYAIRVGEVELVLRRPPFGSQVKSAHDMGREYTILSAIHDRYRYAPRTFGYCQDESVIGAKFYVMERIPGIVLRREKLADWYAAPETVRAICTNFVKALADLHAIDWKAAGLDSLRKEGHFMERQVLGWEKRYYGSQTDDIEGVQDVFDWCKTNLPADTGAVLIHNDFKFDNVLLGADDISKVAGVLDWEMSTIGDPLMDLGVTIGYWVNREGDKGIDVTRGFLTREPGAITRQEFVDLYGELSGRDVSNMHYYFVFALIKLAVVIQQIYYRYATGKTTDPRFAPMIMGVKVLTDRAREVIDTGEC